MENKHINSDRIDLVTWTSLIKTHFPSINKTKEDLILLEAYLPNNSLDKLSIEGIKKIIQENKKDEEPKLDIEKPASDTLKYSENSQKAPEEEDKELEEIQKLITGYKNLIIRNLTEKNHKIGELIADKIQCIDNDNGNNTVISIQDLMNVIRTLCTSQFTEDQYETLQEVFAQLGNEEYANVDRLLEYFEETGLQTKSENEANITNEEEKKGNKRLKIETLDDISIKILMKLTKYIFEKEVKLYDLFSKIIYTQAIKTKKQQRNHHVMPSSGFFEILRSIDVLPYPRPENRDDTHQNLSNFLCIEPTQYSTVLIVNKLLKTIYYFTTDPGMREKARLYFESIDKETEVAQVGDKKEPETFFVKEETPRMVNNTNQEKEDKYVEGTNNKINQQEEQKESKAELKKENSLPLIKEPEQNVPVVKVNSPHEEGNNKREEHNDLMTRQLNEKYNYDEEFVIESDKEAKTPVVEKSIKKSIDSPMEEAGKKEKSSENPSNAEEGRNIIDEQDKAFIEEEFISESEEKKNKQAEDDQQAKEASSFKDPEQEIKSILINDRKIFFSLNDSPNDKNRGET